MTKTASENICFLLVDDKPENLLSLEALLKRDGLTLLKARSGHEALELLLKHDVALALLDVQMPVMDGFELAELMRGTERTGTVPIIFLTAGGNDKKRRFRGYEAGAVDFLYKPIEPDVLRSKTDVFYELYRQRMEVARQRDELRVAADENARLLDESRKAAEALKEADRRKDEFIAMLAHELRNPLAPIRNGLQILRMNPEPKVSEDIRDMMDRQLTHMVRLIDDLLDAARVSQGKIELRKEPITLQMAVETAIEASKPTIDTGKHALKVTLPDAPLPLEADPTRLAQIISNLLNNAAKYTPEGGIITLTATQDGNDAVLSVTDNGLGIPADMLPKIFELFTQVDQHFARAQGGLGIGLSLVKQLVTMHGGTIRAESAGQGKGSTFTLRLPLVLTEAAVPATDETETAEHQEEISKATGLNVMVVDDNIPSAQTTSWMLEMLGHRVSLAHDGDRALTLARETNPDIIFLDIGLPGKNGYEVCRELRADPAFAHTPIVAQTGWGQVRDRVEARVAGFTSHLTKPVDFEKFSQLIGDIQKRKAEASA